MRPSAQADRDVARQVFLDGGDDRVDLLAAKALGAERPPIEVQVVSVGKGAVLMPVGMVEHDTAARFDRAETSCRFTGKTRRV